MSSRPRILAYYFPSWHVDPRNEEWFGTGWTEWELLRTASPRFDGHRQPRIPARGYQDDSLPETFDDQIPLAVAAGVDGFLFDFYWYDDGPYLNRALDEGFLHSAHRSSVEFAIMWANHELVNIFPATNAQVPRLKEGQLNWSAFVQMTDHVISRYFSQENYLRIDGKPWFSVYEIGRLIEGFGSIAETARALRDFEARTIAAGFPGLHLDGVLWGFAVLPEASTIENPAGLISTLGFSSATSYVWIHHIDAADSPFPVGDWNALRDAAFADYEASAATLSVPVYPNATVGWDPSPRTDPTTLFEAHGYPWTPVWDATPDEFKEGLLAARDFLDRHRPEHPLITINAWNEWTEGSALLPDTHHGTAYLDAIRETFGPVLRSREG